MRDPTREFFEELARRNFDISVTTVSGTVGFDIRGNGEPSHWFVRMDNGKISVDREPREANCVVHVSHEAFDRMLTGNDSPITAMLRGAVTADGDLRLLLQFQRLLPTSPGRDPRDRPPPGDGGE